MGENECVGFLCFFFLGGTYSYWSSERTGLPSCGDAACAVLSQHREGGWSWAGGIELKDEETLKVGGREAGGDHIIVCCQGLFSRPSLNSQLFWLIVSVWINQALVCVCVCVFQVVFVTCYGLLQLILFAMFIYTVTDKLDFRMAHWTGTSTIDAQQFNLQ